MKQLRNIKNGYKIIPDTNEMYSINELGVVLSYHYDDNGRIIKTHLDKKGYIKVRLSGKTFKVHRLLATIFIPNPENKNTVNHKDGNKSNNVLSNLEWATQGEQIIHAYKLNLRDSAGIKNPNTRFTIKDIDKIRSKKYTIHELSSFYNCRYSTIQNIINNKTWKINLQ